MLQAKEDAYLVNKVFQVFAIDKARLQYFDSRWSLVVEMFAQIHIAKCASTQAANQAILGESLTSTINHSQFLTGKIM
jgi:hypothetical protein